MMSAARGDVTCSVSKAQRVSFDLNSTYKADEFRSTFSATFRERRAWKNGSSGVSFHVTPFPCCVLDNFLSEDMLLAQLEGELKDQTFHQKSNDLYKFQQSDDLRECDGACIAGLRDFLVSDMRDWMQEITGIQLTDQVDATCSVYSSTDTLLCHDDELEGRRIAFILYLVEDWTVSDGGIYVRAAYSLRSRLEITKEMERVAVLKCFGTLDLFSVDEQGQPDVIARSLLPKWNSFVFFEVSPVSFHQVAEVVNEGKTRLSVSGWFYGKPFDYPHRYCEPPLQCIKPNKTKVDVLFECVNPRYFDPDIQAEIRGQFEEESSIELQHFLLDEVYETVFHEIEELSRELWKSKGPANKRNYEELYSFERCSTIEKLTLLFQSEPMFLLLSQLTGLELSDGSCVEQKENGASCERTASCSGDEQTAGSPPESGLGPRCVASVRRWSHGSYTLLRDTEKMDNFLLDSTLFLVKGGWMTEYGGYVSYIAKDEDEELLSVVPKRNSLALVYQDKETLKFVKHINTSASSDGFREYFDISVSYWE